MKSGWVGLALLTAVLAFPMNSFAARSATVEAETAELREGPGKTFRLLRTVPQGTVLSASNIPTEGYYKVRLKDGTIGWLTGESLQLDFPSIPSTGHETQEDREGFSAPHSLVPSVSLKIFGGLSLFNIQDVNDLFGESLLSNGFEFGSEVAIHLNELVALAVRAQVVTKSATGQDTTAGDHYLFSLKSLPVLVGAEIYPKIDETFMLSFGAFVGAGLGTSLLITNQDKPSSTLGSSLEYDSGMAFSFMAKMDATYRFHPQLGAFLEAGYLSLSTASLQPSNTTSTAAPIVTSGATVIPVALNLSGLFVSAGVSLHF